MSLKELESMPQRNLLVCSLVSLLFAIWFWSSNLLIISFALVLQIILCSMFYTSGPMAVNSFTFCFFEVYLILKTECSVGHRSSADINLPSITLKMLAMSSGSSASWWQVRSRVNHCCSVWMCHFNGYIWWDKMVFHQVFHHTSRHGFCLNFILLGFSELLEFVNLCPSQNS